MADAGSTCVFAQTVMPDSTLSLNSWRADLGETPLDEVLGQLSGIKRGAYEYAWLDVGPTRSVEPPAERALEGAKVRPAGLWARRVRISLRRAPLLIQEVFLPGMGRNFRPDLR